MQASFRKIRLILNPAAGTAGFDRLIRKISRAKSVLNAEIETVISRKPGDITRLSGQFASDEYPVFISGGDGSVHEAALGMQGRRAPLAILPTGSGNGLARHLKIPLRLKKAVGVLVGKSRQIRADMIELNGKPFVNVGGIGFDGVVAREFNKAGKRGIFTYIRKLLSNYYNSREFEFSISLGQEKLSGKAWVIAIANSSEYGNGAKISPGSLVTDGLMDLVIIRKPRLLQVPVLAFQVMNGKSESLLTERYRIAECRIELKEETDYHLDGEYIGKIKSADCRVIPSCLNLLVPKAAGPV